MAFIYHERQENSLCGKHCLNNLLQGNMFDQEMMHKIAEKIEKAEQRLLFEDDDLRSRTDFSDHQSLRGDFSIEVLLSALSRVRLALIPARHPHASQCVADQSFRGVIVQRYNHWFSLRKIASHWLNVDSLLQMPSILDTDRLLRWLSDAPPDVNAFLVVGDLPPPEIPKAGGPWVQVSDLAAEEVDSKVTFERMKLEIQNSEPTKPDTHVRDEKDTRVCDEKKWIPTKLEHLMDLGYDATEANLALGLCEDDVLKAMQLLDTPAPSSIGSPSDTQLTNQINAMVKEVYVADNAAQVVQTFFQICRLATTSSTRKKILCSSLRDALNCKRENNGFLSQSVRDEIHRFYKQLEEESPMYQRCKDMSLTDLETRCALMLYPTQLDDALDILMQQRSDPQELFGLLRSSTCENDARAFLLRVAQVAAGNPAETPTDELVRSLRGQKQNLGIAGLAAASRLLEYLDHREGATKAHHTKQTNTSAESNVCSVGMPHLDSGRVRSESLSSELQGRSVSFSSTALPRAYIIGPGATRTGANSSGLMSRTVELFDETRTVDGRRGDIKDFSTIGADASWRDRTTDTERQDTGIVRGQEARSTIQLERHDQNEREQERIEQREREQRQQEKRERERQQEQQERDRKHALRTEQEREQRERQWWEEVERQKIEERARSFHMHRWKEGVRDHVSDPSSTAGSIRNGATSAPTGTAFESTSVWMRNGHNRDEIRMSSPTSNILALQASASRDVTIGSGMERNTRANKYINAPHARYDCNRYSAYPAPTKSMDLFGSDAHHRRVREQHVRR